MDERVFTFKHHVHNWLKDAEMERVNTSRQSSKMGSKSSSSGSSRKTKTSSSGSRSSRSSKERAVEEKAKLAELIAEAEFIKLAKAKARTQVYEAIEEKRALG